MFSFASTNINNENNPLSKNKEKIMMKLHNADTRHVGFGMFIYPPRVRPVAAHAKSLYSIIVPTSTTT